MSSLTNERVVLSPSEIILGKPIPWNISDETGRLLLRKGVTVHSQNQIDVLVKRGVYRELTQEERGAMEGGQNNYKEASPFTLISVVMVRLEDVLNAIAKGTCADATQRILKLTAEIQAICELHPDQALGAVHLAREGSYTVRHAVHISLLVELLAKRLDYSEEVRSNIVCAALTANVGMQLEHDTYQLQEEPLDSGQKAVIDGHPQRGLKLLRAAGIRNPLWLLLVKQHHERVDGSGYPDGLSGESVMDHARLIGLADIYHAKISGRSYRTPFNPTEALRQVFLNAGKDFDARVAAAFIREIGIYPPGSAVLLANGDKAIVTHRGNGDQKPRISSVITPRGVPYLKPFIRDFTDKSYDIREACSVDLPINVNMLMAIWGEKS
jgi:HD-GYP domain-containing protein (c-di-GMP phosphodiesterase class II)